MGHNSSSFLYISFFSCQGLPYSGLMWKSCHACIHTNYTLAEKPHLLLVWLNDIFQVTALLIFLSEWIEAVK